MVIDHVAVVLKITQDQRALEAQMVALDEQRGELSFAIYAGDDSARARLDAVEQERAKVQLRLEQAAAAGEVAQARAETHARRANALEQLKQLHGDAAEEFRHRLVDVRAKGAGSSSDLLEKLVGAFRRLSAIGNDV